MTDREDRYSDQEIEQIDLIRVLSKGWKALKKTWWMFIILAVICVAGSIFYTRMFYTPRYNAAASFTVNSGTGMSSYESTISMTQISATFPYILESGALKDVVMEDLGLDELPGTISASVLEDTNLFQISVEAEDAQTAYNILESVINNYPTVARYVIGDTILTMLDNSGVPTQPVNVMSLKKEIAYGLFTALIIYFVILCVYAAARKTVVSEDDLKKYTSMRCLANIPKTYVKRRSSRHQKLMLINQRSVTSAFTESVNMLRIRTGRLMKRDNRQVMLISSSAEGEGKTTVAGNLALAYAMKGYSVLLIDGDLRRPSLERFFGMEKGIGFAKVLDGSTVSEEAVRKFEKTHLHLLAGDAPVHSSKISAMLSSENLKNLISKFRKQYDYIFIDTPPCGLMQDAAMLAEVSDCALVVIRQDYNTRDRILAAIELLADTGIELFGYVINNEETGIGSYGYGRYGYGKYGYGKYGKYGKYGYGEKSDTAKGQTD